ILGIRKTSIAEQTNKRLSGIYLFVNGSDGGGVHLFTEVDVNRGDNPAIHRDQMRRKLNGDFFLSEDRQLLFDLGKVPMFRDSVGTQAFVTFYKEIIRIDFAASTGNAT